MVILYIDEITESLRLSDRELEGLIVWQTKINKQ